MTTADTNLPLAELRQDLLDAQVDAAALRLEDNFREQHDLVAFPVGQGREHRLAHELLPRLCRGRLKVPFEIHPVLLLLADASRQYLPSEVRSRRLAAATPILRHAAAGHSPSISGPHGVYQLPGRALAVAGPCARRFQFLGPTWQRKLSPP